MRRIRFFSSVCLSCVTLAYFCLSPTLRGRSKRLRRNIFTYLYTLPCHEPEKNINIEKKHSQECKKAAASSSHESG